MCLAQLLGKEFAYLGCSDDPGISGVAAVLLNHLK